MHLLILINEIIIASRRGYFVRFGVLCRDGSSRFSRPGRFTRLRLLRYDRREWKKCPIGAPLCASAHLSIRDRDAWVRYMGLGLLSLLVPVGIFFLRLNQWTAPRSTWRTNRPCRATRPCLRRPKAAMRHRGQVHAVEAARAGPLSVATTSVFRRRTPTLKLHSARQHGAIL